MDVRVTPADGYMRAELQGTIDENCKQAFDDQIHPLIENSATRLVLDLSGSDRITSAGIGLLVTLVSRANTKGSEVVFANPSPFVASIFKATKLTKFFDVVSSLEEATARWQ